MNDASARQPKELDSVIRFCFLFRFVFHFGCSASAATASGHKTLSSFSFSSRNFRVEDGDGDHKTWLDVERGGAERFFLPSFTEFSPASLTSPVARSSFYWDCNLNARFIVLFLFLLIHLIYDLHVLMNSIAQVVERSLSRVRGTRIDATLFPFLFSRLDLVTKNPSWPGIEPWSPA